jgi:hypothetical protein
MKTKDLTVKSKGTKATAKKGSEVSKFNYDISLWPIGAKVAYTASRVAEHKGLTGVIEGHRPTNGLWVRFSTGTKGSISIKTAKLLSTVKAKVQRKPKPKATEAPAEATEPSTE